MGKLRLNDKQCSRAWIDHSPSPVPCSPFSPFHPHAVALLPDLPQRPAPSPDTVTVSHACFGKSLGWGLRAEHKVAGWSVEQGSTGRPAACGARPALASRPILGKATAAAAAAAARYVTAVSQRTGMRGTLCSPLCERTCWDQGGAGPDITARVARPRAPPSPAAALLRDSGLSSCSGDSRRPQEAGPLPQPPGALALNGPGSPRPLQGSQGNNWGKGSPGGVRQLPWKGHWVTLRGHIATARP